MTPAIATIYKAKSHKEASPEEKKEEFKPASEIEEFESSD